MKAPNLGVLALVAAATGMLATVFVGFHYAPTLDAAQPSLAHLREAVPLGGFLLGVRHWALNAALVLAAAHGAVRFVRGDFKGARRWTWLCGCALFVGILKWAYTGYLVNGDERAYTGLLVMDGIVRSTPLVGDALSRVVQGGETISSLVLVRIWLAHLLLLPLGIAVLAVAYLRLRARDGGGGAYAVAEARRDARGAFGVLAGLAVLALAAPPALGPAADPAAGAAAGTKPEWFFLWVNELLSVVTGAKFLVGAVLPAGLVALGFAAPWLARRGGPATRTAAVLVLAGALGGLSVSALARDDGDAPEEQPPETTAPPEPDADDLDDRVRPILRRFDCGRCHALDGDEDSEESGPPFWRDPPADSGARPFRELYDRPFFRAKVGDPAGFWHDPDYMLTGMRYPKRAGLPTKEQLDLLERWFFGDE